MNRNTHSPIDNQIETLLNEAKTLRWTDYHRLIEVSEQALALSRKADNPLGVVTGLNYIGWGYNRLGTPHQAMEYSREALHIAQENNHLEQFGYALCNMAYCYGSAGEIGESLRLTEQLISIAEAYNFVELQAFGYNDLSIYYTLSKEYAIAIDLSRQVISLIDEHQLTLPKTFPYLNIAESYLKSDDVSMCLEYCNLAYQEAINNQFPLGKIHSEEQLSHAYLTLGNPEKALHYAQQSYQTALSIGYDLINPQFYIAQAYTLQERYDEALKIYHEIEQNVIISATDMLNPIYTAMSELYAQKANYEAAYRYLQKAGEAQNHQANDEVSKRVAILKTQYKLETVQREAQFQQAQTLMLQSEMEERLKRQRAELTLEKQRELMQAKNDILARINHEFRTPISILRMSFELLTRYHDRLTAENKEEHIRRIEEQFQHISNLLDDVLDALNIDRQSAENLLITAINLEELAISAIAIAEKRTRAVKRVQLHVTDIPATIYHNQDSIEQIIIHLLTNAIKFSTAPVSLHLSTIPDDYFIITVSDSGIGIPPEEQSTIFDVLARGSNLNEIGGNGMGLALVRQTVKILGGEIKLDSQLNVGTKITVSVPLSLNPHSPTP